MLRNRLSTRATLALAAAFLSWSSASHAIVDMKNANYSESWLDLTLTGTGYNLRVNRTYNSRSVFNGMFGFGWCSDFETVIEKLPEGRLKLTECGAGQEVIYAPTKYDPSALDKVTEAIVAHYKKKNPQASPETVNTLRQQVRGSEALRLEWAKDANLPKPETLKGTVYASENLAIEQITFDGTNYTRGLADGSSQRFDAAGKLSAFYDKNGNYLKFSYGGNTLKDVIDNTGKRLAFTFINRRVKEIVGPGNIKAEYVYRGEDLVEVKNMWKNTYAYKYDETHNLIRIDFPDKTFKALTYNQKKDWVTSFTDRVNNGVACTEAYDYQTEKKDHPGDHFWSTVIKKCGTEIVNQSRYEFWHKTRVNGKHFLARVLTSSNSESMDVSYHPDIGRPISIKKNGVTTTFEYFTNGLIKEKSTAISKMIFEYKNQFNKVSKVTTDFLDEKGKSLKRRETGFVYDGRSNLIAAQNTDGQTVKLSYDNRGRIATIVDQAKKEVMIKYDDKTGKPSSISLPKVGTINVSYKQSGEISKVDSTDGPTVAVQIASTFSNLLDIISPATSELSL